MPNVNTIILILSLAVLAIIVLSTLFGFLAGLKREIKLVVVFVVLLLLVWLLFGNASTILDASLPSSAVTELQNMLSISTSFETLRQALVEFVKINFEQVKDLMVEGTHTYALVMSIVEFAVRAALLIVGTVVVYILYLLIRLLSFIIGGIIRLCLIKKRRRKLDAKQDKFNNQQIEDSVVAVSSDAYDGEVVVAVSRNAKKVYRGHRRWWGALLGFLRGAFVVVLLCTPFYGLLTIVDEVEPETFDMVIDMTSSSSQNNVAESDTSEMVQWLMDLADAYQDSAVHKSLGVPEYFIGQRLEEILFNDLFVIRTSTQTIYMRDELITLIRIANLLPEAYVPDKSIPIDIWLLDDETQDELFNLLKEVKLLAEVMPVGVEFAGTIDYVKDLLEKSEQTLESLIEVDWKNDLPLIIDAMREAVELGNFFEDFDPLKLDSDVLRKVVSNLGETEFLTELMPVLINAALYVSVVEQFVGPWPGQRISTNNITWKDELLNLVDVYELFQDLGLDFENVDFDAILADDTQTTLIEEILTKFVTSNLFIDVIVPIVDVAKEFQIGELSYDEFAGLLTFGNLDKEDWASDIHNLVEMAKALQQMNVLNDADLDFDNVESIRTLVAGFFDLMILSDKVSNIEVSVDGQKLALKTLIVEAAIRQFKLFDTDTFTFYQFTDEERAAIDWAKEKEIFLKLVDDYGRFVEFANSKDQTALEAFKNFTDYLDYDETWEIFIDLANDAVDSELAITAIPYAVEKFLIPFLDDFEKQSGYEDQALTEGLSEQIKSVELKEEILSLLFIVLDAKQLNLTALLKEGSSLNDVLFGALAWIPEEGTNTYEIFKQVSETLGYEPAVDDLAIVDIVERIFGSKLIEGREGKVIRILLAVFLDVRVTLEDMESIDYSDSEKQVIINALNELKVVLTDPEFRVLDEEGKLDIDYLLTSDHALVAISGLQKLLDSKLIEVLLPEVYNQYVLEKDMIPSDVAELVPVQSNWLKQSVGLTGAELTHDIKALLSIAEIAVNLGAIDYYLDRENNDISLVGIDKDVTKVFDLINSLNILNYDPEKLISYVLDKALGIEITEAELDDLDANWNNEINVVRDIILDVLEISRNSSFFTVNALLDMFTNLANGDTSDIEYFIRSENVEKIGDIFEHIAESQLVNIMVVPLVNKFLVPALGIEEITREQYPAADIKEDILTVGEIIKDLSDPALFDFFVDLVQRYTDLIAGEDDEIVIPYESKEVIGEVIEKVLGLNLVNLDPIKQYAVDTVLDMLGVDKAEVDVSSIDLKVDGEAITDALVNLIGEFEKTGIIRTIEDISEVIDVISTGDIKKIYEEYGDVDYKRATVEAALDLVDVILDTTLVAALDDVIVDYVADMVKDIVEIDTNEYPGALLIEDAHLLVDIARQLLDKELAQFALAVAEKFVINKDTNIDDLLIPYESKDKLGNIIKDVFALNILQTDSVLQFAVDKLGEMLNVDVSDVNVANLDLKADGIVIADGLVNIIANIEKTETLIYVKDIFKLIDDLLGNPDEVVIRYKFIDAPNQRATIESVLDFVDAILDTTLIAELDDIAVGFIADMVKDIVEIDPELYTGDLFVEDAHAIVDSVRQLLDKELDAFALKVFEKVVLKRDIDLDSLLIPYSAKGALGNIIKNLFGLNALQLDTVKQYAINMLGDMLSVDVSDVDVSIINLRLDGEAITDALVNIISSIESTETLVYVVDIFDLMNDIQSDPILVDYKFVDAEHKRDVVESILDFVDAILDSTLVNALDDVAVEYIANMVKDIVEIDPEIYVGDLLVEDAKTLVNVVRQLVDKDLAHFALLVVEKYVFNLSVEDIEVPYFAKEILGNVVRDLFTLNALQLDTVKQYIVDTVGTMLDLDVSDININEIDLANDGELFKQAIIKLIESLEVLGIFITLDDVDEVLNDVLGIDLLPNKARIRRAKSPIADSIPQSILDLIQESQNKRQAALNVLDAVDLVLETTIVNAFRNVIVDFAAKALEGTIEIDTEEYTGTLLLEDLHSLVEILRAPFDKDFFKFIAAVAKDMLFDEEPEELLVPYDSKEIIAGMIEDLLGLHIVNTSFIKQFGIDMLGDMLGVDVSSVDVSEINLAQDGAVLAADIVKLIEAAENTGLFVTVEDLTSFLNLALSGDYKAVLETLLEGKAKRDGVLTLLETLDDIIDTTLVQALDDVIIEYADKMVEDMLGLDLSEYTGEMLVEDLHSIVDVVRELFDEDMTDFALATVNYFLFDGEDVVINYELKENIGAIFKELLTLNILNLDSTKQFMLDKVAEMLDVDASNMDVSVIDLTQDGKTLSKAIVKVLNALEYVDIIVTIGDAINVINDVLSGNIDERLLETRVITNVADELLGAVDLLLDLTIVDSLSDGLAEFAANTVSGIVDLDLSDYTGEMLVSDAHQLINVVRDLLEEELIEFGVEMARAFFLDGSKTAIAIPYDSTDAIHKAISDLFELEVLDLTSVKQFIVDQIAGLSNIDTSDVNADDIDLAADGVLIADAVVKLIEAVEATTICPTVKDLVKVINGFIPTNGKIEIPTVLIEGDGTVVAINNIVDAVELLLDISVVNVMKDVLYQLLQDNTPEKLLYLYDSIDVDDLLEDVDSILDALRIFADNKLYQVAFGYNIELEAIKEPVTEFIDKLLHIHVLTNNAPYVVAKTLETFTDIQITEEELEPVEFEHEVELVKDVVLQLIAILEQSDITSSKDVINFVNDVMGASDVVDYLLNNRQFVNNDNLHALLNIVEDILESQTLEVIFGPAVEAYVEPLVQDFFDLDDYTYALAKEDLKAILAALHEAVDWDLLAVYRDGAEIDYTNTKAVKELVSALLSSNLLALKKAELLDYVTENIFDISYIDADDIDFVHDIKYINNMIEVLMTEVCTLDVFPIHYYDDIKNADFSDYKKFLEPEILLSAVNAVEKLVGSTILDALLDFAYNKLAPDYIPDEYLFIMTKDLDKEALREDFRTILDVARTVIESEKYLILFDEEVEIAGLSQLVKDVLVGILSTHIIGDDINNKVVEGLKLIDVEVDAESVQNIDILHDVDVLTDALQIIEDALLASGFVYVSEVMDEVKGLTDLDTILENRTLLNNDNIHAVLNAVEKLLDLTLLSELYLPVGQAFADKYVESLGGDSSELFDLTPYDYSLLKEDLHNILAALHEVVDFDILGIYRDDQYMDFENTKPVEDLIKAIINSNLLNVKLESALAFVSNAMDHGLKADVQNIDLANDAELIAQAVALIMKDILAKDEFPIHFMNDIQYTSSTDLVNVLSVEAVNTLLDAVDMILDTTLLLELAKDGVEIISDFTNEKFELDLSEYTNEGLVNDLHKVVDIIRNLLVEEVLATVRSAINVYVFSEEEDIYIPFDSKEQIGNVVRDVLELEVINLPKVKQYIFDTVCNLVGLDKVDASLIDLIHDGKRIGKAVSELIQAVEYLEIVETVDDLMNLINDVTAGNIDERLLESRVVSNVVNSVLNAVEKLLDTTIVDVLDDPAAKYLLQLISGILKVNEESYTGEILIEDVNSVIAIVRSLLDEELLDFALAMVKDKVLGMEIEDVEIPYTAKEILVNAIAGLFDLNIVKLDELKHAIVNTLGNFLKVNVKKVDVDAIDLSQDGATLANIVGQLIDALEQTGLFVTVNDLTDFIDKVMGGDYKAVLDDLGNENITNILQTVFDILDEVIDLTIVAEMEDPLREFVVELSTNQINLNIPEYTGALLREDLHSVVDILRNLFNEEFANFAIDAAKYLLFEGDDVALPYDVLRESLSNLVKDLFELNVLQFDSVKHYVVNTLCDALNVSRSIVDVDEINLVQDGKALAKVIVKLVNALEYIDFVSTLDELMNLIKDTMAGSIDEKLYNARIIMNVGNEVLDAADLLIDTTIVNALRNVLAELVDQIVNGFVTIDLSAYTGDMLMADAHQAVQVVRDALVEEIVEFAVDTLKVYMLDQDSSEIELPYNSKGVLGTIVLDAFQLQFVNLTTVKQYLVDLLGELLGVEVSDINVENIDMAADGIKVGQAIVLLLSGVEETNILVTLNDVELVVSVATSGDGNLKVKVTYNRINRRGAQSKEVKIDAQLVTIALPKVLDAIDLLVDTTLVNELSKAFVKFLSKVLADYVTIDASSYTGDKLVADLHQIIATLHNLEDEELVNMAIGLVLNLVLNSETKPIVIPYESKDTVARIINDLLQLELLAETTVKQSLVDMLKDMLPEGLDISEVNVENIDLGQDGELIASAIISLIEAVEVTELFYDMNDVMDMVRLAANGDIKGLLSEILESETIDEALNLVLSALDNIVNTSLVQELSNPLVDYAIGLVGDMVDIDLSEYTGEMLVEDLHTIIDVLGKLLDDELSEFALAMVESLVLDKDEEVKVPYESKEIIGEIVAELLTLNLVNLESVKQFGIDKVAEILGADASKVVAANINLAQDGELIGEAIVKLINAVQVTGLVENVSDVTELLEQANDMNALLETLADAKGQRTAVLNALDALDLIIDTTIVEEITPLVSNYLVSMLESVVAVDLSEYENEMFVEDLHTVVNIVRQLMDETVAQFALEMVEKLVLNRDVDPVLPLESQDIIYQIVKDVFGLNIINLEAVKQSLVELLGDSFNANVDFDVNDIDLVADGKLIGKAITSLIEAVKYLEVVETYDDLMGLFSEFDETILAERIIKNVANSVLDAVDYILDTTIVNVLDDTLGEIVVSMLGDMLGVEQFEYTGEELLGDVDTILNVVRELIDDEILGFEIELGKLLVLDEPMEDLDIPYDYKDTIGHIVEKLFGLNILQEEAIKQFAIDKAAEAAGIDASEFDVNSLELAEDGVKLGQAVVKLIEAVEMTGLITNLSDINDLLAKDINGILEEVLAVEVIKDAVSEVLDALDLIIDTTVVEQLGPVLVAFALMQFADSIDLDLSEYTGEMLAEDLHTLIDVVRQLLETDEIIDFTIDMVKKFVLGEDVDPVLPLDSQDVIYQIVKDIFGLNIINLESVKQYLVDMLGDSMNVSVDFDVNDIDLVADGKLIGKAITSLIEAVKYLEVVETYDDLMGLFSEFDETILTERIIKNVANSVLDAIDYILDTTIVNVLSDTLAEVVVYMLRDNLEVEVFDYVGEELLADVGTILNIVRELISDEVLGLEIELFKGLVLDQAINNSDMPYEYKETLAHIVEELFALNLLQKEEVKEFGVNKLAEMLDVDTSDVDVNNIDLAADGVLLGEAVKNLADALELTGLAPTVSDLCDLLDQFSDMNTLIERLVESETLADALGKVLDALQNIIDTTLVQELSDPLVKFAISYLEDLLDIDLSEYTGDMFVEDVNTIIASVRKLLVEEIVDFGLDMVNKFVLGNEVDPALPYGSKEIIGEVVADLFTLNLVNLEAVKQYGIDTLADMLGVDASDVDVNNIDLVADGAKLGEAVVKFMTAVEVTGLVENYSDIEELLEQASDMKALLETLADAKGQRTAVLEVLDALDLIIDTTIVYELSPVVSDYLVDMLAGIIELDLSEYTNEMFVDDLHSLINIVRQLMDETIAQFALEMVQRLVLGEDIDPVLPLDSQDVIYQIVKDIFNLNIINLQAVKESLVELLGDSFNANVDIDVNDIDLHQDGKLIGKAIVSLIEAVKYLEVVETYDDLMGLFSEFDETILTERIIKNVANSVLDAVDYILETSIVNVLSDTLAEIVVNTLRDVIDVEPFEYSGEELLSDADIILNVVREFLDETILPIEIELFRALVLSDEMEDLDIPYGYAENLGGSIEELFALNILQKNEMKQYIVDQIGKVLDADVSSVDVESIALAQDGETLAAIVVNLIHALENTGEFVKLSDITEFAADIKSGISELDNDTIIELVQTLLDSVDQALDLTIVQALKEPISEYVNGLITGMIDIDLADYTGELLFEDAHSVINILRNLLVDEFAEFVISAVKYFVFDGEDVALPYDVLREGLSSLVKDLLGLNILNLNGTKQYLVDLVCELTDTDTNLIDINTIDLVSDAKQISKVVVRLVNIVEYVDFVATLGELVNFVQDSLAGSIDERIFNSRIVMNVGNETADIIDLLVDTTIFDTLAPALKDLTVSVVNKVIDVDLADYTVEMFEADAHQIAQVLRDALVEELVNFALDTAKVYMYNEESAEVALPYGSKDALGTLVLDIFSLELVDLTSVKQYLVDKLGELLGVDVSDIDVENIDMAADGIKVGQAIVLLLSGVEETNILVTLNDVELVVSVAAGSDGKLKVKVAYNKVNRKAAQSKEIKIDATVISVALPDVLDGIDLLIDTTIVSEISKALVKYLAKVSADYVTIDPTVYTNELLVTDLHQLVAALHKLENEEVANFVIGMIIKYAFNKNTKPIVIPYESKDIVGALVYDLLQLFVLNQTTVKQDLVDMLAENLDRDFSSVDVNNIDLAYDGESIASAVVAALEGLQVSHVFNTAQDLIETVNDIMDGVFYSEIVDGDDTPEAINHIADAAEHILATSVFTEFADVILDAIIDVVPEKAQYLFDANYSSDSFIEDAYAVLDALRIVADNKLYQILFEYDYHIEALKAPAVEIIDILLHTHIINDEAAYVLAQTLNTFTEVEADESEFALIDFEKEYDIYENVLVEVIDILIQSDITLVSEAIDLVKDIIDSPIDTLKNSSLRRIENAYSGLDILEELYESKIYMEILVDVLVAYEDKLPADLTDYIDLSLYSDENLYNDYLDVLSIARTLLDSGMYKLYKGRSNYEIVEESFDYLAEIVSIGCDLDFTAIYTEGLFRLVFDRLNVESIPDRLDEINLAADKDALVQMIGLGKEMWLSNGRLKPTIPSFAHRDIFENLHTVLQVLEETTLFDVLLPWAYNEFAVERISSFNSASIDVSALEDLTDEEIVDLYEDIILLLEYALDLGVFGTQGIDFANEQALRNIYNMVSRYIELPEAITSRADDYLNKSYLMGVIVFPYEDVTSTKAEIESLKDILRSARDLYDDYLSGLSKDNLSKLGNDGLESTVMSLLDEIEESVLLNATFIDLVNGFAKVVVGPDYADYQAINAATFAEFKEQVPGLFDMLDIVEELGVLDLDIKYKNTPLMADLVHLMQVSPFIAGQEGVLIGIALKVSGKFNNISTDFSHVTWDDEYNYLYNFLEKAYYPLNLEGVEVSTNNIRALAENEEFVNGMADALEELADSQVLVEFFERAIYKVLNSRGYAGVIDYSHLDKNDYDTYAQVIRNEFLDILTAARYASRSGVVSAERFNVIELTEFFDIAMGLEGIRYTKNQLFNKVIDKLPEFGDSAIVIPEGIDWDEEVGALHDIIAALQYFADAEGMVVVSELNDIVSTSTNVEGLEALLSALNKSQIYRPQLYSAMHDKFNDLSTGDFTVSELLTDWFEDQNTNGMLDINEWDEEIILIARMVAIVNSLNNGTGFDSFVDIKLGIVDGNDASTVATAEFETYNYGLRQLLQLMGASKSFDLAGLNNIIENALIDRTTDKSGEQPIKSQKNLVELTNDEWVDEIDDLIELLSLAQNLDLINGSESVADRIISLEQSEIEVFLEAFNHVAAMRELLPDLLNDAMNEINAENYKGDWLVDQCGVDADGNNNPMASEAEWDAEIAEIAKVIVESNNLSLNSMSLSNLTDEELDSLETMLIAMNNSRAFNIDAINDDINDLLSTKGYTTTVLGVMDRNNSGSNRDEWTDEIPVLMDIISQLRYVDAIDLDTVTDQAQAIGTVLDTMKSSYIFGNDVMNDGVDTVDDDIFNSLIMDVLTSAELIKTTSDGDGFIAIGEAEATDWSQYDYATELVILSNYDRTVSAEEQSDDIIKTLAASEIVKDFFDIATIINDKIDGVTVTIYGETLVLANYINNGNPLTNEDLDGSDWSQEIDDANAIIDAFNQGSTDVSAFKSDIEALISTGNDTLAVDAAEGIKAELESSGVWDLL